MGRKKALREIRICQCGKCSLTFECKVNSKRKYKFAGHSRKGKVLGTYVEMYGVERAKEIKKSQRKSHLGVKKPEGFGELMSRVQVGKISPFKDMSCEQIYGDKKAKIIKEKLKENKRRYFDSGGKTWSYGLTKETDSRVLSVSEGQKKWWKEATEEERIKRIKKGFNYKGGHFYSQKNSKSLHYRSPEELIAYQMLECNIKVVKYEVEVVIIPYEWNGGIHRYFVDLLVYYDDGTKQLIEVKMKWALEKDERTKLKIEAGKKYAERTGIKFSVWTENNLYSFSDKGMHSV